MDTPIDKITYLVIPCINTVVLKTSSSTVKSFGKYKGNTTTIK